MRMQAIAASAQHRENSQSGPHVLGTNAAIARRLQDEDEDAVLLVDEPEEAAVAVGTTASTIANGQVLPRDTNYALLKSYILTTTELPPAWR